MVLTNEFGKVVVLEPGVISEFKIEKLHLVKNSETRIGNRQTTRDSAIRAPLTKVRDHFLELSLR